MTIKPPYPSDLAAKGWHLDLDYERIQQSDTWALASAEQRPWLLMLWLTSWHQVPVASLPKDNKLIAARIGMPLAQFEQWADVLLSGWQEAEDGRLYHGTLTEIALKMVDKRLKEKARIAKYRASISAENVTRDERVSNDGVTRYTHVTTPLVTHEYTRSTTPSPSPSPSLSKEKNIVASATGDFSASAKDRATSKESYTADFEIVWGLYPKRPGASKADALKAYTARRKEGITAEEIAEGVKRYAKYCAAEISEPKFIKQPETFFGPGRHFESDWNSALNNSQPVIEEKAESAQTKIQFKWHDGKIRESTYQEIDDELERMGRARRWPQFTDPNYKAPV